MTGEGVTINCGPTYTSAAGTVTVDLPSCSGRPKLKASGTASPVVLVNVPTTPPIVSVLVTDVLEEPELVCRTQTVSALLMSSVLPPPSTVPPRELAPAMRTRDGHP